MGYEVETEETTCTAVDCVAHAVDPRHNYYLHYYWLAGSTTRAPLSQETPTAPPRCCIDACHVECCSIEKKPAIDMLSLQEKLQVYTIPTVPRVSDSAGCSLTAGQTVTSFCRLL